MPMSAPQLTQPRFKVLAIAHNPRPQVFSWQIVQRMLQPPPFCPRQKPYRPALPLELCASGDERLLAGNPATLFQPLIDAGRPGYLSPGGQVTADSAVPIKHSMLSAEAIDCDGRRKNQTPHAWTRTCVRRRT